MTNDDSIKDGAIIPEDKNRQLSLPSEMVNRGLQIASKIESQRNIQKYQKPIRYFPGTHARSLIDFSNDGKTALITANSTDNPDLIIWNVTNGAIKNLSSKEKGLMNLGYMGNGRIWSMVISSHGDIVVAGYDNYDILCWDVKNNSIISRHIVGWNTEPVEYLKFLPDDEHCIVGYDVGVMIINARSGERSIFLDASSGKRRQFMHYLNSPGLIELLKDGTHLRVEEKGHMKLIDLQNKQEPKIFKDVVDIRAASTFPDPEKIITINSTGFITILNSITGEVLSHWFHRNPPLSPEKSKMIPEEQWEFLAFDPAIRGLNQNNKEQLKRIMRCEKISVDVSPDGTRILSAGGDNYMRLWNLEGQEICKCTHNTRVVKVAFLPEGGHALSGCLDGSVYLWELPN
jgi:WD40 repeat protein